MKHTLRHILLWGLVAVLCTGCTGAGSHAPLASYTPGEDQRLVIYTSHKPQVYQPLIQEFEARTGIWVELVAGGTNQLLDRLEQEAEQPQADVMFGGGVDSLEAYAHCFAPYRCANWSLLSPSMRSDQGLWTPFSALPVVFVYNPKLVAPGQLTTWQDLLSHPWQGRIAFCDPRVSGSSFTALATLMEAVGGDRETVLRTFADNLDGRQLESSAQVLESVSDGTDLVGITLEETALQYIQAGAELEIVYPQDGTSLVPDGGAMIQGCPHPQNARLFLDFITSQDVQQRLDSAFSRRSVRVDCARSTTLPPVADIPQVSYDISQVSQNHNRLLMSWAFYFGGGTTP